ncbi:MAG: DUF2336 domain-containing protein [Alphaproteobacteria bacterium]
MSAVSQNLAQARSLIDLARHDDPGDRAQLFSRVADLFQVASQSISPNERALLVEIMRALSVQVDLHLRLTLAERLCDYPNADHDLICMLAHDKIEVATPIILKSVVLTEQDLVEIVHVCSVDHWTLVARRPEIPESVSDALVETQVPGVLRTLAGNVTAKISPWGLERLADSARDDKALLSSLVTRHQLPQPIALRMYAWASTALRRHILENFKIDPKLLDQELANSVSVELSRDFSDPHTKRLQELVTKLSASGQLKAGFLLKALREDQIDLFRLAFAKLADVEPARMSKILANKNLRVLALAVRAVGIDRSAFPTILQKLHCKNAFDGFSAAEKSAVNEALAISSQDVARVRLEAALRASSDFQG